MVGQSLLRGSAIAYSRMLDVRIPGEDFIVICEELEKFVPGGAIKDFKLYPDNFDLVMRGAKKDFIVVITPNNLRFRDHAGGLWSTRKVPNERMHTELARILRTA